MEILTASYNWHPFGQDFYQTYARTRVERGFYSCPFFPQTQENKLKMPRKGTFSFLRESQVAHNSGDIPF